LSFLLSSGFAQTEAPAGRILNLNLDPQAVTSVEVRPGFVTAVRLPEPVSSVVVGDPVAFKAEHSEAEPQLVFFKPTIPAAARTNALITTRSGREVSLSLVSDGLADRKNSVDYVLKYDGSPRSFLIDAGRPSVLIAQTMGIDVAEQSAAEKKPTLTSEEKLLADQGKASPRWRGSQVRASVGASSRIGDEMTVAFSVLNSSSVPVELLPPQIELTDAGKDRKHRPHKAEPVAIITYRLKSRRLEPGERTDGYVTFERPAFKTSAEHLVLKIAQAEKVDQPVDLAISFVPSELRGETK
jgi:hypothetical protein